ncbi:MAG: Stp1/IreP family PP2C-type Ser/Thr phosphatase [Clostridia bacterium]|nr:Stp1/IreP family PP2C-type Ser/Thr phosphatase [Clostridia bacterium]MDR3645150.1 Stp1/IreP family PP2C-type Ser/Thr phosphatase [Clostridia bacterium]
MRISGKTDVGKVRKTNQDSFYCGEFRDGAVFAVVCDGMGGVKGGSEASSAAVEAITASVQAGYTEGLSREGCKKLLVNALADANTKVYEYSLANTELQGMGTTVVAGLAFGSNAVIVNAGDSRAYLFDSGGFRQITRDHSIVQDLLESGKLTPDEAATHPQKNIITRALGVAPKLETDVFETEFPEGAGLLFCTDGLTNNVSVASMEAVIREKGDNAPPELIRRANDAGGSDNITVVILFN